MFMTIRWELPLHAFYGTAQGRALDAALDALAPDRRLQVWHVTVPQDHFLFHNEEDARAFVRSLLLKNRSFKGGRCRYEGGEHFSWPAGHAGAPLSEGHVTLWPHTEALESQRQRAIQAQFEAACAQARRLFDNPGQRSALGATHWADFLNAKSRARLTEEVSDGTEAQNGVR